MGDQLEVLAGPKNSVSGGDLWVMDDGEQNFQQMVDALGLDPVESVVGVGEDVRGFTDQ